MKSTLTLETATGKELVTAFILQLKQRSVFFSRLALYAKFVEDKTIPTLATDCKKTIFYNLEFLKQYDSAKRQFCFMHEVMHVALRHGGDRRGQRDSVLWNIAGDYVINLMLREEGFELIEGIFIDDKYAGMSVEQVYDLLMKQSEENKEKLKKLLEENGLKDMMPGRGEGEGQEGEGEGGSERFSPGSGTDSAKMDKYWKQAIETARTASKKAGQGSLSNHIELDQLNSSKLNPYDILSNFVTKSASDFCNFDRRFISRDLYLETLENETLKASFIIDASGSISRDVMVDFISFIMQTLMCYPNTESEVFFFDGTFTGPHPLDSDIPDRVEGGGGTSLHPVFEHLMEREEGVPDFMVIMTDLYLDTNLHELCPTLWMLSSDSDDPENIPFGDWVRFFEHT